MKKICALALFAAMLICSPGCGGPKGGSVIENADQSAVEAYQAEQAAEQKRMESEGESLMATEEE